ncbi:PLP-dependent aspartate aminotransferase family protein [Aquimarina sp. 2201CG5-10]|uniref:trans-sulfuration enzyme family protein n=1 Tax=Aquimarina callyspongiae TaxID=3098150 RepID=UPI002AB468BA|nr:PLP-dependent aspartate aminotransferase family protein [Aquimarina sp. 2201CG5-10]MDY8137754.1 PLP-dependent aspartate aminotransferase family protein [Aquimarina sp. 2201CG5-10]
MKKDSKLETILTHYGESRGNYHGAVVPPIFQNSLFTFDDWESIDTAFDDRKNNFIYSRGKNPTVSIVEEKIAKMAGGEKAQLFPSGMAAITAACLHFLEPNDHVIAIKNLYGPASTLLKSYLAKKMNIETSYVSGECVTEFENAIQENTKLIYLESPSSVVFSLQDIEAVAQLAQSKGIKTIIDNTWATPIFQKPLAMGIDLEVHSCSKYLGGHSDLIGGVVIGKEEDIDSIFLHEYELLGSKTAPMEAWLLIRSLRTLSMRLQQHQTSALKVAEFLENHSKIKQVTYPGLPSFPQYELGKKQMTGYGSLMAFQLKTNDLTKIKAFFNSFSVFQKGVSWGGHESLVYVPAISYLKELDEEQFKGMGISVGDIRIFIGLEHVDDLIQDLDESLKLV